MLCMLIDIFKVRSNQKVGQEFLKFHQNGDKTGFTTACKSNNKSVFDILIKNIQMS